ncbi:hypothetical protein JOQ06_004681 [Pogonophryne albipinna]|uniref:Uncharacterized protein n=1 Tax=Pogonophryne albipinna TaxID=1090488 RepID=A0AAD6ANZ5_9TELE|nr:hypothetical protein JOQ06_004681 [Pogonophryne albipinna]
MGSYTEQQSLFYTGTTYNAKPCTLSSFADWTTIHQGKNQTGSDFTLIEFNWICFILPEDSAAGHPSDGFSWGPGFGACSQVSSANQARGSTETFRGAFPEIPAKGAHEKRREGNRRCQVEKTHKISFYQDFSKATQDRRRSFLECKRLLHSAKIPFGIGYPAVLSFTAPGGTKHRFDDPKKAMQCIITL